MGVKERWQRPSWAVTNTKRWRLFRWSILERDGFRCVQCGARGRLEVDHIIPVRDAPDRAYDPENLQSLCPRCHGQKTNSEMGRAPSEARLKWRKLVQDVRRKTKEQKEAHHA